MSGAVVTVRGPSGELCVDLIEAARNMSAAEQQKLFRHIGRNITDQDCQSAMDALAEGVVESRKTAAQEILGGKWPVRPPIPTKVLRRFVDAQLKIVLSVCKIPELYFEDETK